MFELRAVAPDALHVADLDGRAFALDVSAVAALSREGRDASGQRRPDVTVAPDDSIAEAQAVEGGWTVALASGRRLTLTQARLFEHRQPDLWRVPPRLWTAAAAETLPVYDYTAFHGDEAVRRRALLQMAAYGFVRLRGAPAAPGEIETAVKAFGCLRETNYGRLFDVKTRHDPANLADTALALAAHTDNPYRLAPPEVQILHCLSAAGEGGRSVLVDGRAVIAALSPEDREVLSRVPARFAWSDGDTFLAAEAPVITAERIRYNPRSFQQALTDDPAWMRAWTRFGELLSEPAFGLRCDMAAGDMVLMDNRRVLHGRTAFDASGAVVRHLQGAYADMDGVHSTLRRLTEAHVERELDRLEALFAAEGLSEAYGEAISIRDHMLQSAEGAVLRKKGADLVAAALLHDIGWGMGGAHEATAADLLEPVLGARVANLIRHHVAAKRYLVATRPDYAARLSPASAETLKHQGGPMTPEECRAFEALPDFELCLDLRYLDEAGKDLSAPVSRFADYREILKAIMVREALAT